MAKKIKKIKEDAFFENEVLPYKYLITNYGADYTVDVLIKRMRENSITVPSFQRSYVWKIRQASRFIESLLLGLPVPGVFFSREKNTEKLLVIDGQQRLLTLFYFYEGVFAEKKKIFALDGVQPEFDGKTYKTLSDEDKRKLNDAIIHATIIKQDVPSEDESSIFFIFERLNTGGMILSAQEIRNCIYHGDFNELLKELNQNKNWRFLYGKSNQRMRDQELILRFFALHFEWEKYTKPIKAFLNSFMARNKDLKLYKKDELINLFSITIDTIHQSIGKKAFRLKAQPTAALIDAVMVGVSKRLQKGLIRKRDSIKKCFLTLLKDNDFVIAITTSTSDEENVRKRIEKAISTFSNAE